MNKSAVIGYFNGHENTAKVCNISRQAVYLWQPRLKKGTEDRILAGMIIDGYRNNKDLRGVVEDFIKLSEVE